MLYSPAGAKEHGAKFQLKLPSFQRSTSGANAVSPRASSWSAAATLKDGMWNVLIPRGPIRVTPESVADIDIHLHDAWRHGGECDRHGADLQQWLGSSFARNWPAFWPKGDKVSGRLRQGGAGHGRQDHWRDLRTSAFGGRRASSDGGCDQRAGGARHRRRRLSLFLFARDHGRDAKAAHQRGAGFSIDRRPDEPVRQYPGVSHS